MRRIIAFLLLLVCFQVRAQDTLLNVKVNNVTFDMVFVKGGTFDMGCNPSDNYECYDKESPVHNVTLSDYYIGRCEVTQKLWNAIMGENPSRYVGEDHPVEMVTMRAVGKFIKRLYELTGMSFRLPTEAEWEYAAKGGAESQGYDYSGSDDLDDVTWYIDNCVTQGTQPVAGKKPNELGIYDMSGNVYEWCSDWYDVYKDKPQVNPEGPMKRIYRVRRGGAWNSPMRHCRSTNRSFYAPAKCDSNIGFRLVLPVVQN